MEQLSYNVSLVCFAVVMICWIVFAAVFLLRKRPARSPDAVNAPKSWVGIIIQGLGYAIVWSLHRWPWFSSFTGEYYSLNIALQVVAAAISIASVILTMSAIRELGKQWSLEARLVEGHQLIRSGPYALVRHPIYTAMLGKLIATGIVLSHWFVLIAALIVFLIGTLIRIRFEEKLLSDAFGDEFAKWKAKVPALIPFLKV
ncbi:MAG: isoprenylcysteine carboxylmethyltransferase family protein [Acidobacteria bacterium]|nr:isoprenylcysteine carboxylmethyltransferase family protein [Acidobacteriota bacterium]